MRTTTGVLLFTAVAGLAWTQPSAPQKTEDLSARCDRRDGQACATLALRYEDGAGGVRDTAKAAALYEKALTDKEVACAGLAVYDHLGALYDKGDGVPVDKGKALFLYDKACTGTGLRECGRADRRYVPCPQAHACLRLDEMRGLGTNPAQFAAWYRRVAAEPLCGSETEVAELRYRAARFNEQIDASWARHAYRLACMEGRHSDACEACRRLGIALPSPSPQAQATPDLPPTPAATGGVQSPPDQR